MNLYFKLYHYGARVIGVLLGSFIARNNQKVSGLCELQILLVATEFHLIQNIALLSLRNYGLKQIFYAAKCIDQESLRCAANGYGFDIFHLSFAGLVYRLVRCTASKQKVHIYVPHLSEYLSGTACHLLLIQLYNKGILRFYDDGLSAICPLNRHVQLKTMPLGDLVYTWDYSCISCSKVRSSRVAFRSSLVASRVLLRNRYPFQVNFLKDIILDSISNSCPPKTPCFVLASKGLSLPLIRQGLNHADLADCFYIPHYQVLKNNSFLLAHCNVVRPEQLEASLLGLLGIKHFTICFGITSTILYLLEALLEEWRDFEDFSADFLFCCDSMLLPPEDIHEHEDFKSCIFEYASSNVNIRTIC